MAFIIMTLNGFAECHYAVCHNEVNCGECHNAECCNDESRGTVHSTAIFLIELSCKRNE
jgi:hypothetical protein